MKNKSYLLNIIAIISVYVINGAGTFENAAIQTMVEAWPSLAPSTIRLMVTLPSLTSTFVMMLVGQFVGKKITFKKALILGTVLSLVGGVLPFFMHTNWYFILVCRVVLGFGMGILSIRSSMLMLSSEPHEIAKFIGLGAVFGSICSALIAPLSGKLAQLGWYYPFLTNAITIIAFIMVALFAKEPQKQLEKKQVTGEAKIPPIMYVMLATTFIMTMVLYPLLSGISTYLKELNIGDASTAGWMLALYTGSAILTNLFLGQIHRFFKDKLLAFFSFIPVVGLALVIFPDNIYCIAAGIFLSGIGCMTISSAVQVYAKGFCDEATLVKVSPYLLAMGQLGMFLSSYFIEYTSKLGWFETSMKNPYFICLLVYFVNGIISYVFKKQFYPFKEEA